MKNEKMLIIGGGIALAALIFFGEDTIPDWIPFLGGLDNAGRITGAIIILLITWKLASMV